MQQINIRFLNLPDPSIAERFADAAARAFTASRNWADEAYAAGLVEHLPPAAAASLLALFDRIATRSILDEDGGALVEDVLEACADVGDSQATASDAGRRSVELALAQRDGLVTIASGIAAALDLAAALRATHRNSGVSLSGALPC